MPVLLYLPYRLIVGIEMKIEMEMEMVEKYSG
jgi:hypothetical protein